MKFLNKKKSFLGGFFLILILLGLFIYRVYPKNNLAIYLDGQPVKLKSSPLDYRGKTYLPLGEMMQALGYDEVREDYSLTFSNESRKISHRLGRSYAYINNRFTYLGQPSILKNGRIYSSIDSLEKMASLFIESKDKKAIYMESPPDIKFLQADDSLQFTSYNKDHQILGQIVDGSLLISGHIEDGQAWTLDSLGENSSHNLSKNLILDNSFKTSLDLKESSLLINAKRKNSPYDHPMTMDLVKKYRGQQFSLDRLEQDSWANRLDKSYVFARPTNYNENLALHNEHSLKHPKNFLDLDFIKDLEERREIEELALEISQGLETDYEKVLAIHNWLVENLAYDYEKYYSGDWSGQDPYLAMKEGRTLCEGFAFLNMALCRSIDIPSKLVFGFASKSSLGKEELSHRRYGHAWNEIFVDGRWIIVDSTWNSKNTYNKGFYLKNINSFLYFDISLKTLSKTHLIENYPIY